MSDDKLQKKYNKILKKKYGYDQLKELQFEIIKNVVNKNDVISLLPTSYGKSICYQMPFLITKKSVIVISPLISLMEDQVRELKEKDIDAICLNSANKNKDNDISDIFKGNHKIIYTSPEYIVNNYDLVENLAFINQLALIAIDECHCISAWGHSFRNDYQKLDILKDIAPDVPILALTATATDKVIKDVEKNLSLENTKIIKHSVDRPNLYIEISQRNSTTLQQKIIPLIENQKKGKTLIYCKTTKETDKIAKELQDRNFICDSYHAKKTMKERKEIQKKFTSDEMDIIISTIAFGMGINIPNIRLMIHYNCSNDIESYMQEIGRAGRDGKQSKCYMFFSNQDFNLSNTFLEEIKDKKIRLHREADINYLKNFVSSTECRRKCLLKYFGEIHDGCNNCDNCKGNKYQRDFTKESFLLFSLINCFTSGFGQGTYIKLLLGSKEKQILKYAVICKQYYGKGSEYKKDWWEKLITFLFAHKYLREEKVKNERMTYSIIKLSESGKSWLNSYNFNDNDKKPKMLLMISDTFKKYDKDDLDNEIDFTKKMFNIDKK